MPAAARLCCVQRDREKERKFESHMDAASVGGKKADLQAFATCLEDRKHAGIENRMDQS